MAGPVTTDDLDTPDTYQRHDPRQMHSLLQGLPQQGRSAWEQGLGFPLPEGFSRVSGAVFLGMGGSAIGADLLAHLPYRKRPLPFWIIRDSSLPPFVGRRTLVIASSFSGETEETLSAFSQALEIPCPKLAITTGGRLAALARERDIPLLLFSFPGPPRAALGYMFFSLLGLLKNLSLLALLEKEVNQAFSFLEGQVLRLHLSVPEARNPAKALARKLADKIVVIYGAGFLAPMAYRWKTQINENSKAWAFSEAFPELNHNSIVGYQFPREMASKVMVVLLYSPLLPPSLALRYKVTEELLERAGVEYERVTAEGETPLSQMLSCLLFGDYVSYYLALLHRVDPWPVTAIDYLKARLRD